MACAADRWEVHDGNCCCCHGQASPSTPAIVGLFIAGVALIAVAAAAAGLVVTVVVRTAFWGAAQVSTAVDTYRARPKPPTAAERLRQAEERSEAMERAAGLVFGPDGRLLH